MARVKAWHVVAKVDDLEKGDVTPVVVGQRELAIYDGVDGISISYGRCTHGAANLCDGYFDGRRIECPLHQGLFDALTGKALAAPARVALRMIDCKVEDGQVLAWI